MKVTIKKGNHYPRLINRTFSPLVFNRKAGYSCKHTINFGPDALYDLKSADNHDTNKIFGFSTRLLPTKTYPIPHQYDSFRWGWHVSSDLNRVEILPYTYIKGLRFWGITNTIEFFRDYLLEIVYEQGCIFYFIDYKCVYTREYKRSDNLIFGYKLGAYFGGNNVAPYDISFNLD